MKTDSRFDIVILNESKIYDHNFNLNMFMKLFHQENFLYRLLDQINEYEIEKVFIVSDFLKVPKNFFKQFKFKILILKKNEIDVYIKKNRKKLYLDGNSFYDDSLIRDIFIKTYQSCIDLIFKNKKSVFGFTTLNNKIDTEIFDMQKNIDKKWRKCELKEYHYSHSFCESQSLFDIYKSNKKSKEIKMDIVLEKVNILIPMEKYIQRRKNLLTKKIKEEQVWTNPIIVEKENKVILDGHHRYAAACELGLNRVPVIYLDYNDVEVWSLRFNIKLSKKIIIKRALEKNIFDFKSTKHKFPRVIEKCNIPLNELVNKGIN
jgi:L-serine kinase (ADP)